jgi:hypothetical protein
LFIYGQKGYSLDFVLLHPNRDVQSKSDISFQVMRVGRDIVLEGRHLKDMDSVVARSTAHDTMRGPFLRADRKYVAIEGSGKLIGFAYDLFLAADQHERPTAIEFSAAIVDPGYRRRGVYSTIAKMQLVDTIAEGFEKVEFAPLWRFVTSVIKTGVERHVAMGDLSGYSMSISSSKRYTIELIPPSGTTSAQLSARGAPGYSAASSESVS